MSRDTFARPPCYPFPAIVGQGPMKKALLLAAVNPALGGVLIRGEKGTGKSTAVRSLAVLLPEIETVTGCPCNCPPSEPQLMCPECRARLERGEALEAGCRPMRVVDLPLGATEDRVVGSLNLERALREGERHFEPGLLAAANRGILYVDEVNLLDDHLVDVLLDAAASGRNIVEREGISVAHPAAFILVGTMNPEEGELRPQLLDRFGLCVEVRGLREATERAEVVRRRLDYEGDPTLFQGRWAAELARLKEAVGQARSRLPRLECPEGLLRLATGVCLRLGVAGHRADLCLIKCARTLAALRGAAEVERPDVLEAATLVLPHRLPRAAASEEAADSPRVSLEAALAELEMKELGGSAAGPEEETEGGTRGCRELTGDTPRGQVHDTCAPYPVRQIFSPRGQRLAEPRGGRRGLVETATAGGRYVDAALPRQKGNFEVAVDATLRAAAPRQVLRQPGGIVRGNLALKIEPADLRQKVRSRRSANTVVFAVDASGSMAAAERMGETKGAVLSLLHDAHLKRDRVGLVSFRGSEAELVLAPTNDLERGRRSLARLRVGGATPLSRGLALAHETLRRTVRRRREGALLVVISDGKANRSMNGAAGLRGLQEASQAGWHETRRAGAVSLLDIHYGRALEEALEVAEVIRRSGVKCLVVDTAAPSRHAQMRRLSLALGAAYVHLEDLRADRLAQLVGALLRPNPTQNRR